MKIAIIGAGAMGCLYGAKFSAVPDNDVVLVDVWKEHVDAINREGLQIERNGTTTTYKDLRAVTNPSEAGIADFALIFVKSTLTEQAVIANKEIFGENTVILTLQNGLGNVELIAKQVGKERVIAGTTVHGAGVIAPGKIHHAGEGQTVIGELDGKLTSRIEHIKEAFEKARLQIEVSQNIMGLVWDKLIVNVGINALTGITRVQNGKLVEHRELEAILEGAVKEAVAVAEAKGIKLNYDDPIGHVKDVCVATAANKASMLQDILNKKKTEIEMINGAVVREGVNVGVKTPVNGVLCNLIRFFEKD